MTQREIRTAHDLGATATSIIRHGGLPVPETEAAWLRSEMRSRSLEHAPSQLVGYAIRLTSSLSSLSFEERFGLAHVLVDVESLAVVGIRAEAPSFDELRALMRTSLWSAPRAVVDAFSTELERADVHGPGWGLPVLIQERLAREHRGSHGPK